MAYLLLVEVDNLVNAVDNFFREARVCYRRVGHPHRPRNGKVQLQNVSPQNNAITDGCVAPLTMLLTIVIM